MPIVMQGDTGSLQIQGENPAKLEILRGQVRARVQTKTYTVTFSLTEDAELAVGGGYAAEQSVAGKCTMILYDEQR